MSVLEEDKGAASLTALVSLVAVLSQVSAEWLATLPSEGLPSITDSGARVKKKQLLNLEPFDEYHCRDNRD